VARRLRFPRQRALPVWVKRNCTRLNAWVIRDFHDRNELSCEESRPLIYMRYPDSLDLFFAAQKLITVLVAVLRWRQQTTEFEG
jgi:hypothetical protein